MGNQPGSTGAASPEGIDDPIWLQSEDDLKAYLEGNGVSTALFGTGSTKSLTDLLYELRTQACFLELQEASVRGPALLRVVEPVFIRLCWQGRVLVREEQQLTDGCTQTQKMLLAEKKDLRDGGSLFATVVRALHEELDLAVDLLRQEGMLQYRADAYHLELEQADAPSYPGLASMYRTHHVQVDITEEGLGLFRHCGLPECGAFEIAEEAGAGRTVCQWCWYDVATAMEEGVVRLPPEALPCGSTSSPLSDQGAVNSTAAWQALSPEEVSSVEGLGALLAPAGLGPARYGEGEAKLLESLLKEVQAGECRLERCGRSGLLRCVVESVFVRVLRCDKVLVEAQQTSQNGRGYEQSLILVERASPEDVDVSETALRGLRKRLGLPEDFPDLDGIVEFVKEAYCCAAEKLDSSTTPGLSCVNIAHCCGIRLLDAGLPHFQVLGLLADEFEAPASDKPDQVNCWRWIPVDEVRQTTVQGLFEAQEPTSVDGVAHADYERLDSVPSDSARLRALLEAGGVRVKSWGNCADTLLESLAGEVDSGVTWLERDPKTGGLRRVVETSLVQLVAEEPSVPECGLPARLACKDVSDPACACSTSSRSVGQRDAWGLVHLHSDLGFFEVMQADTASYPGLPCCYQTRLVQFEHRSVVQAEEVDDSPVGTYGVDSDGFAVDATVAAKAAVPERGGRRGRHTYPRLLDAMVSSRRGSRACGGSLAVESEGAARAEEGGRRRGLSGHRSASIVSMDDGLPMSRSRPSLLSLSSTADVMISEASTFTPKRRSLYRQLQSLQEHLRFKMVANEAQHSAPRPAEQAVACACDILLIRNVNPMNATFHCRFVIFLEWLDSAAVGLPLGPIAKETLKEISVPEIGLQNTLGTSLEVHSPPEVVNSQSGHVACKVLFQALMQMELNMRLFPFDEQRLVLVLGLRARKDRSRAVFCQFCSVDRQIRLDEWGLTGSFYHADRPDGRARVQFGVVISRAYWYYIVNVLATLAGIASMSLVGFLLDASPPFDRLRFGVATLFAQTTFRLSIENKLPKVSYATAFDAYAMFCQLLVLSIMVSNALSSAFDLEVARMVDPILASVLGAIWIIGNAVFVRRVSRLRSRHHESLQQLSEHGSSSEAAPEAAVEAFQQLDALKAGLHFHSDRRASMSRAAQGTVRAVSVATRIWLLHDIDPISATFECKFTVYLEWIQPDAVGLPEGDSLSPEQLALLDPPELDVHNKVELTVEAGPCMWVVDSSRGQVRAAYRYHARLQIHLNLRRFPFDSQRLPINLTMPNEKDHDRAFVYRNCHLAQTARCLDEWIVDGLVPSTDYTEGVAQAMLEVCIRRRSMYYVVSVLLVLLGISSLVFTVFVIDVGADGSGFVDQGKILAPLLMTLLAFKLLISSGKIPKAAYATIFDRIMLACEALFFLTTLLCAATLLLAIWPQTAGLASAFRTHVAVVLLTAWLLYGAFITLEVWCGSEDGSSSLSLKGRPRRSVPTLGQQRRGVSEQPELTSLLDGAAPAEVSSVVLAGVEIQQVHSVNATTATFVCEYVVSLAWVSAAAKGLPHGEPLSATRLAELQMPILRVQNALTFKQTFLSGCVVSSESGHVACRLHFRAQLQLHFKLDMFPYDRQALAVVLALPEPQDTRRHLVLHGCDNQDAVKISEWSLLGTFAGADRLDGIPQVVFGVTIQRSGQYYIASLRSLCLWASSVFSIYTLEFEQFHDRGKILVCVLLVTVVGKLAVSSKLPRIARLTSYDKVALNTMALHFCVGCSAAFWCLVGKLQALGLHRGTIALLDRSLGALMLVVWVATNMRIARNMRPNFSRAQQSPPDVVPPELRAPPSGHALPEAAAVELVLLRRPSDVFAPDECSDSVSNRDAGEVATTTHEMIPTVSVGIKIWMVCNVDASTATFECKFHVFLDWFTPAAVDMPESTHISRQEAQGAASNFDLPRLRIKNTICVLFEDWSDIQVKNNVTGQVSCRVQYHVRMYHGFNLRRFPFDCQRLEIPLELQNCKDRYLVPEFCEADDQTMNLDGWVLAAASMYQHIPGSREASIRMLVERESHYYVLHVIAIFFFLTTLMFSFYLMRPHEFTKRLVDVLKIVLTQTTFRFSVEHRLPKVQHWTPFDMYVTSCQALCCCIILSFIYSALTSKDETQACVTQELEHYVLAGLTAAWLLWNAACAAYAGRVKHRELRRWQLETLGVTARRSSRRSSRIAFDLPDLSLSLPRSSTISGSPTGSTGLKRWESEASSGCGSALPQVISIAFRIWLVRNVDLVTATFECKFRVFLEWLDEDAVGLPKGKKAKLPVPQITITNAVQSQILDRSSAPEVVNSETGHLAVQILYRATLRMDQEVHQFPFDCQWLAITLSLRDEGTERSRSFMFQYCEVDGQLQLDEWQVHPQPAFSTLTKDDAPSIQDTVMCGILIRRNARYYVVNIMGMLCLISSLVFAIYTIDVRLFWERAEVFLGIFPLTVLFKMSAQGKLPRVGYSTKFDLYASACQVLFLAIVLGCMLASIATNLSIWVASSCPAPGYNEDVVVLVRRIEFYFTLVLLILWIAWNAYFTAKAVMVQRLAPLDAVRSPVTIRLQDEAVLAECSTKDPDVNGLAPRLSVIAAQEKCSEVVGGDFKL